MRHRLQLFSKWKHRASELEAQEKNLHTTMHPDVSVIVRGERLLLLKRIADDLGWPDSSLLDELAQGFVVGAAHPTGVFPVDF